MFKHEKQLFHPVAVERTNPQYAALLQEQLGAESGHAVYVPELPHQGPEDQGPVSGYRSRGTGTHGNGGPDH